MERYLMRKRLTKQGKNVPKHAQLKVMRKPSKAKAKAKTKTTSKPKEVETVVIKEEILEDKTAVKARHVVMNLYERTNKLCKTLAAVHDDFGQILADMQEFLNELPR
eukprot:5821367-Amphidinium_carterae.1